MTEIDLANVLKRFAESDCSWLSTVRPDGRPHSAPIWHVWHKGSAYVVTLPSAVKIRNIRACDKVVITHPNPHHAIIIEGIARQVEGMTAVLQPHFQAKYDWDIATDEAYNAVIEIRPTKLLAWGEEGAGSRCRWSAGEIAAASSPSQRSDE